MTELDVPAPETVPGEMSHRQILEALSGLLMINYVALVSSTIVTNALPSISADLGGTQTGYTWVVVSTMLAMTASTPIWGKLADQFDNKLLVQVALGIFILGSLWAGFAPSMESLIAARVLQGVGVGGLMSLVTVVIARMVSPRERGRYAGYVGASFALASLSGPLLGGVLVDTAGWRWCFFIGVPIALVAFVLLQVRLKIGFQRKEVSIDYVGSLLTVSSVSVLLVWVSLGGRSFDWTSGTSGAFLVGIALLLAATIAWEGKVATDPVIPMRMFRDRAIVLPVIAALCIGMAMFGAGTFMGQYFQMARGMTPTEGGLMSIPMVVGMFLTTLLTGRLITRTGRWKRYLLIGMSTTALGLFLLGLIGPTTHLVFIGLGMTLVGGGLGMSGQNLMLAVQNSSDTSDMGVATAAVGFFRSIGGSAGVAALGAILSYRFGNDLEAGVAQLSEEQQVEAAVLLAGDRLPNPAELPDYLAVVVQDSFGSSTGMIFLVSVPFVLAAVAVAAMIKETTLRTTVHHDGGAESR